MPQFVYECFVLAFDVLWVGGLVDGGTRGAVCKSCDASFDKVVNVVRDGSDSNRFATI